MEVRDELTPRSQRPSLEDQIKDKYKNKLNLFIFDSLLNYFGGNLYIFIYSI